MTPERILAAVDGTWPAARMFHQGPFTFRQGQGGGQRVSAATARRAVADHDIPAAEAEMRAMGQAIIDMGRVLQGREAVVRSYADHATHELKTPLTVVRGAVELLDNPDLSQDDRARLLARIDGAAERMTDLLEAQRLLARAQEPLAKGTSRLADILPDLVADHPDIDIDLKRDATLPMGEDGLRLVLDHLLGNAARHGATRIELEAHGGTLTVTDNGPGVSDGNRDRIFDPFFTTRREAGGTGMGLAIVKRMLEAHGAEIALGKNAPGASFQIVF